MKCSQVVILHKFNFTFSIHLFYIINKGLTNKPYYLRKVGLFMFYYVLARKPDIVLGWVVRNSNILVVSKNIKAALRFSSLYCASFFILEKLPSGYSYEILREDKLYV